MKVPCLQVHIGSRGLQIVANMEHRHALESVMIMVTDSLLLNLQHMETRQYESLPVVLPFFMQEMSRDEFAFRQSSHVNASEPVTTENENVLNGEKTVLRKIKSNSIK